MSKKTFFAGLVSGLSSTGSILEKPRYPSLKGTDVSRMRNDVSRVGSDFSTVIDREHGKENTQPKPSRAAAAAERRRHR